MLQREMPVPIWGWSQPGARVTIEFQGQKTTAVAGTDGKWLITLDPLKASTEPAELVVSDEAGNRTSLKDILVGEVWICSGQSNMQYGWGNESHPMFNWGGDTNLAALVPDAKTRPIRSFAVLPDVSFTPVNHCNGSWSTNVSGSAVAFGFSYHLSQTLNVPVGVMVTCWGSSSIEGWMPRELTAQLPHFKATMEAFDANTNVHGRIRAAMEKGIKHGNTFVRQQPNLLYNAMLHPLLPYASRGLVWYQGEANAERPDQPGQYARSLPAWIKRLRTQWGRDDFHFLGVMLPGYGNTIWPRFREVQLGVLQEPHTSVANTIDLGDEKNIHPADKAPIGERLALLARRDVYGEKIEAQGPVFKRATIEENRVVVEFVHAAGLKTTDGAAPTGFQLAGNDRQWLPAVAINKGNTVELAAEGLAMPVFVRYAFTGKPAVNLVNEAGLPAYPFRTDDGEMK
ncbi:MAG TPA: sialate O-acetylesterase [Verrucomicrobia bacterium]|nr:sialate O-acetylesterase [Verrucomicrobiota bacterium]